MRKKEMFANGADISLLKRNIDQNTQYYVNNKAVDFEKGLDIRLLPGLA